MVHAVLFPLILSVPDRSHGAGKAPIETAAAMAPLLIDDAAEMREFEALLQKAAVVLRK